MEAVSRGTLGRGQPRSLIRGLDPHLHPPLLSESSHPEYCFAQIPDIACLTTPSDRVTFVAHFGRGCCPGQERLWRPKSLGLRLDTQGSWFPSRKWLRWKITQNRDGQAPGDLQTASVSQVVLLRDPWGLVLQMNFCGETAPCILMPRPHPPK